MYTNCVFSARVFFDISSSLFIMLTITMMRMRKGMRMRTPKGLPFICVNCLPAADETSSQFEAEELRWPPLATLGRADHHISGMVIILAVMINIGEQ